MHIHDLLGLDQINLNHLVLRTPAKYLKYGRLLYEYKNDDYHFWVKTQLVGYHEQFEQGFQRELAFYKEMHEVLDDIVIDHVILKLESKPPHFCLGGESLVLPHVQELFKDDATNLTLDQVIHKIILALCALEKLHGQGWIHGDLKKEHFCLEKKTVKLFDFEQCVQVLDTNQYTMNATPHYMAPELFQGCAKSTSSDVYALGIIILEWLKHETFSEKTYQDWAILHCQKLEIELPQHFVAFKSLLKMMLAKHKSQRVTEFSVLKTHLLIDIV